MLLSLYSQSINIVASTSIERFYSTNRPARQSTTVRFQRAPFQSQMSTVAGGKTQPEGRKKKERNGKETSDSFEDDFAREPSTSRGEIGRLKCHISARFD